MIKSQSQNFKRVCIMITFSQIWLNHFNIGRFWKSLVASRNWSGGGDRCARRKQPPKFKLKSLLTISHASNIGRSEKQQALAALDHSATRAGPSRARCRASHEHVCAAIGIHFQLKFQNNWVSSGEMIKLRTVVPLYCPVPLYVTTVLPPSAESTGAQ